MPSLDRSAPALFLGKKIGWRRREKLQQRWRTCEPVWDVIEDYWMVDTRIDDDSQGSTYFYRDQTDEACRRIEQFLGMSKEEVDAWGEPCFDNWLTHMRQTTKRKPNKM